MENLYLILLLIALGYFALYFGGRKYLERFQANESFKEDFTNRFHQDGSPIEDVGTINASTLPENDYPMDNSDNRDSYDISQVFNNQGSKKATKQQLSDAMTRYPLDWSVQGPDSQYFQENQEKYLKKDRVNPEPYQNQPTDMLLPDSAALDDEERKILQTYVPETSKGLLHYSMGDVKQLLNKIYGKKGLIPVIEKSKQGENIWEIVEVKEKNPKIVWEDDLTQGPKQDRREDMIDVPYTVSDIAAGMDPFKQRNRVRTGKFDIEENTELSRMFQPTYPIPYWN
jgi:hypothetical protein